MTTSGVHKIAIIAGDGIGKEVIPAGLAAIEAATRNSGISIQFTDLPWGCDYYLSLRSHDGRRRVRAGGVAAILGAIGRRRSRITLPCGTCCCRFAALRPMSTAPMRFRAWCCREPHVGRHRHGVRARNSEGKYSGAGGRIHIGTPYEAAEQTGCSPVTGSSASSATVSRSRRGAAKSRRTVEHARHSM